MEESTGKKAGYRFITSGAPTAHAHKYKHGGLRGIIDDRNQAMQVLRCSFSYNFFFSSLSSSHFLKVHNIAYCRRCSDWCSAQT